MNYEISFQFQFNSIQFNSICYIHVYPVPIQCKHGFK